MRRREKKKRCLLSVIEVYVVVDVLEQANSDELHNITSIDRGRG